MVLAPKTYLENVPDFDFHFGELRLVNLLLNGFAFCFVAALLAATLRLRVLFFVTEITWHGFGVTFLLQLLENIVDIVAAGVYGLAAFAQSSGAGLHVLGANAQHVVVGNLLGLQKEGRNTEG